jgi:hypothetical protein
VRAAVLAAVLLLATGAGADDAVNVLTLSVDGGIRLVDDDEVYEYVCSRCGKTYRSTPESRGSSCAVAHGPNSCCHYRETVVGADVPPIPLGCDLATVLDALRDASKHLHGETDGMMVLSIYRTQAQQLRDAAAALEAKEAVVAKVRAVLAACDGK